MNNREKRGQIAKETLKILEQGYFFTPNNEKIDIEAIQKAAEANVKAYSPANSDELLQQINIQPLDHPTEIKVTNQTTLDAVRDLISEGDDDVLCLNFASARNPGGGFLGGSQAQEESIARSTGLYNTQMKAFIYYETNRAVKSCIYTDYMIYSPNIPIIKYEDGKNLDRLMTCSVITAPAVNMGVVKHREPKKIPTIEGIMKRRIEKVLAIALSNNHKNLVLGAWGCGVFQNNPNDIAKYFKEVIDNKFPNAFRKIIFAIYAKNPRFIQPFYNEFGV